MKFLLLILFSSIAFAQSWYDMPVTALTAYLHGKSEAYRMEEQYGGILNKQYSKKELNVLWHNYKAVSYASAISIGLTYYFDKKADWVDMILKGANDAVIFNIISDGTYNTTRGFKFFRQAPQTGWQLESLLNAQTKIFLFVLTTGARIIYLYIIK